MKIANSKQRQAINEKLGQIQQKAGAKVHPYLDSSDSDQRGDILGPCSPPGRESAMAAFKNWRLQHGDGEPRPPFPACRHPRCKHEFKWDEEMYRYCCVGCCKQRNNPGI